MIHGFKDGIVSAFNNAVNAVKNGLNRIRNFFPFSPAKEGPFSGKGYTIYSGQALTEDFAKGMSMAESDVVRQAEAITKAAAFEVPDVPGMSGPNMGGANGAGGQSASGVTNNFTVVNPVAEPTSETARKAFGLHRRKHLRGDPCTRSTEYPLSDPKRRWTVHRESQRRTPCRVPFGGRERARWRRQYSHLRGERRGDRAGVGTQRVRANPGPD